MKGRYPLEYNYIKPGEERHNNKPRFMFRNESTEILAIKVKEVD